MLVLIVKKSYITTPLSVVAYFDVLYEVIFLKI